MTAQQAPLDGAVPNPAALADPSTRLERVLSGVPRILASHGHVVALLVLGVYLIVLPLLGVNVPAKYELIGGNYTNVTSDIGACIAAGGTLHMVKQNKAHRAEIAALRATVDALHARIMGKR